MTSNPHHRSGPEKKADTDRPSTDPDAGLYVISVAAELLGIHPQTLRGYERQGLLNPARTPGGTRLYSPTDLARAQRILDLTAEGLTLAGVARVIALEERVARLTKPSTALVLWTGDVGRPNRR